MKNKKEKRPEISNKHQMSLFDISREQNESFYGEYTDSLLTDMDSDIELLKSESNFDETLNYPVESKSCSDVTAQSIRAINNELILPFSYEDILENIGNNKPRLPDLIVPVTRFEELIIQVVIDIKTAGNLLFLYGLPGVGKSTFIGSLKFQKHIPIKEIISIDVSNQLSGNSDLKLEELLIRIKSESIKFFENNNKGRDKLCVVVDYLENLLGIKQEKVVAFFREINGFLRKNPILIIWPVTDRKDLQDMQDFAQNFSSTVFHRRIPVIEFTGPPIDEYPNIAKKTIMFFNDGKNCYDFQLSDGDFENIQKQYQDKPREKQLIRTYLEEIKNLWENRTQYIARIAETIPKPTEVWFVFAYPEAEGVVARFTRQTPDDINEMWNAEYKSLNVYINENTQRKADWKPRRLTLALSSRMLSTKIIYFPTNSLISCVAAYAKDADIPISREDFVDPDKYSIPQHWFGEAHAVNTLKRTPLYIQLKNIKSTIGKRKSGKIEQGLNNAKIAFQKINQDISLKKISDQRFNKAVYLALLTAFRDNNNLNFQHEQKHPYLTNIRPDILVDTGEKIICLEFCYTVDNTPGNLADYVLRKLNVYMKQLEENSGLPEDYSW